MKDRMTDTIFSPDRIYRYTLWREWPDLFVEFPRSVNFICLNPSHGHGNP